jgi:tetratricopeptide (TPR) repeat protein
MPRAKSAALKALELDDTLAESHKSMGSVLLWYDWDWTAAGSELERAIELNPSYSDAYLQYCIYLMINDRYEEALAQANKALELDPLSASTTTEVANRWQMLGLHDEAIEQYEKVLEWQPDLLYAHSNLAEAYYRKGMYDESVAMIKRWLTLMDQQETAEEVENAYASSGIEASLIVLARRFSEKRYIPPVMIALWYVHANEKDKAVQWLEKGYEQRDPLMVGLPHPDWQPLHPNQQFQDLLRRMNFPK